ncbi:hypothetical protein [Streptomyces sp. 147326]
MKITSRILAVAAVSGALLAATAPAYADTDVLGFVVETVERNIN